MDITNKSVIARIKFQKELLNAYAWQSCLSCADWQDKPGLPTGCARFQAMPPPDVIVNGCEWHVFDVPF